MYAFVPEKSLRLVYEDFYLAILNIFCGIIKDEPTPKYLDKKYARL